MDLPNAGRALRVKRKRTSLGRSGQEWQFSSQAEMRHAKQDAHVQYMRQQLTHAWEVLSHHASMAAAADSSQKLAARLNQEQVPTRRNLQERGKLLQLGNYAADIRARRREKRAKLDWRDSNANILRSSFPHIARDILGKVGRGRVAD